MKVGDTVLVDVGHPNGGYEAEVLWLGKHFASIKRDDDVWDIMRRRLKLSFDDWYNLNESEINIELAETGADREMDFDSELEFEKRYEKYLNQ